MSELPFLSLLSIEKEVVTDVFSRRTIVGKQEMIVWASAKAGCHAKAHLHPNEQIFWILSGEMECRVGEQVRTCHGGDIVVVEGGIEHEMWVRQDTEFVSMLAPVRLDLLPGAGIPVHLRGSEIP
jgi:quercetin dioxygenase-like cupin family protein